ncbi:MAG TPA: ABC transporter permease [Burkholderiales bacterium]|jgi:ABC-type transport system involved in multi-copper enzyme maturation permease subunit|nr:ABC transporter permease [Burkholderiales bacterium]
MKPNRVGAIARYTVLEAWRNRLGIIVAVAVALLFLLSVFVRELAVTESGRLQTALLAAALRLASVFLVGLYVLNGLTREFNDKVVELVLSLDLPRPAYVLGKFLGYAVVAAVVALIATIPVAFLAPAGAAAWGFSLALELLLVAAIAVFCVTTFTQLLSAAAFVAAFYLLARSITAIQLMSTAGLVADAGPAQKLGEWLANAMAFVLPRLDTFTQTAWLMPEGSPGGLGAIVLQSAIYVALLLGAAMFDLYRRNF